MQMAQVSLDIQKGHSPAETTTIFATQVHLKTVRKTQQTVF